MRIVQDKIKSFQFFFFKCTYLEKDIENANGYDDGDEDGRDVTDEDNGDNHRGDGEEPLSDEHGQVGI